MKLLQSVTLIASLAFSAPAWAQISLDAVSPEVYSKAIPPEMTAAELMPAVSTSSSSVRPRFHNTVVTPDMELPRAERAIVSDADALPSATPLIERPARNTSSRMDATTKCVAMAVYHEARGESVRGQRAVADVVMNRARSGRWGPTACHVVDAPKQFSNRRSWKAPVAGIPSWDRAIAIAKEAASGVVSVSSRLMNFRAASMGAASKSYVRLGNHVFW